MDGGAGAVLPEEQEAHRHSQRCRLRGRFELRDGGGGDHDDDTDDGEAASGGCLACRSVL